MVLSSVFCFGDEMGKGEEERKQRMRRSLPTLVHRPGSDFSNCSDGSSTQYNTHITALSVVERASKGCVPM